jgi:hypothetical protein
VTETELLREQMQLAQRAFAVAGEHWFDAGAAEWKGQLLFLALDRSVTRVLSTGPVRRSRSRERLLRTLRRLSDREIRRAFRTVEQLAAVP